MHIQLGQAMAGLPHMLPHSLPVRKPTTLSLPLSASAVPFSAYHFALPTCAELRCAVMHCAVLVLSHVAVLCCAVLCCVMQLEEHVTDDLR